MKKSWLIFIGVFAVVILALVIVGGVFTVRQIDVVFLNASAISHDEVLTASKLKNGTVIFNVDDKAVIENIKEYFTDKSVYGVRVERTYPNKVTLFVMERVRMFKFSVGGGTDIVITDKDFQLNKKQKADNLEYSDFITVKNYEITNTFRTDECRFLRSVVYELLARGYAEEGVTRLIKSVDIKVGEYYALEPAVGGKIFINYNDTASLPRILDIYFALSDTEKLSNPQVKIT